MSSFLLARDDRPTWPITLVAVLGGAGVMESGGLWALLTLCATDALHYERQVSNALRRVVRP